MDRMLLPAGHAFAHHSAPFDVYGREALPRVDIVYAYGGADGVLIDAIRQHGTDGLVLVGSAVAPIPPPFSTPGSARYTGIPVVLSPAPPPDA